MFTTTAYAQTAGAGATDLQSTIFSFLPIVLIVFVFYFLLLRPQQQKAKETREQQAALRRGDRIVTAGGVLASVTRVISDDEIEVQIAEGVKIRVVRSTISTVLAKTEPVAAKDSKPEPPEAAPETEAEPKKRRGTSRQ